ncbi:MAG: hypothetical protein ACT4O5_08705 [Gammaproteobacteria bacterium]
MSEVTRKSNLLSIEERAIVSQLALSGWVIREHDPGGYCEQNEFWLENRSTTLRVDQVRKLQSKGWLKSFNGGYRLSDEGRAQLEAASAHEPSSDAAFIRSVQPPPCDAARWAFFREHYLSTYQRQNLHAWLMDNTLRAGGIDAAIDEVMAVAASRPQPRGSNDA